MGVEQCVSVMKDSNVYGKAKKVFCADGTAHLVDTEPFDADNQRFGCH